MPSSLQKNDLPLEQARAQHMKVHLPPPPLLLQLLLLLLLLCAHFLRVWLRPKVEGASQTLLCVTAQACVWWVQLAMCAHRPPACLAVHAGVRSSVCATGADAEAGQALAAVCVMGLWQKQQPLQGCVWRATLL